MNTNVVLEYVSCDICGHGHGFVWLKSKDRGNGSFYIAKMVWQRGHNDNSFKKN
jgi:hypothetical protein